MNTQRVTRLPPCYLCWALHHVKRPAHYDALLPKYSTWAYVCHEHFRTFGPDLQEKTQLATRLVPTTKKETT